MSWPLKKTCPSATSLSVVNSSGRSWRALGSFDDRYADNGNQYTVEPSYMAMCTSGQFVTQLVNDGAILIDTASEPEPSRQHYRSEDLRAGVFGSRCALS